VLIDLDLKAGILHRFIWSITHANPFLSIVGQNTG